MRLANLSTRQIFAIVSLVVGALIAEFFILEGTIGVVEPSNRNSALSSVEIRREGFEIHFVTRNRRFSVVDFLTEHGTRRQTMVIRESFFMDRQDGREGPPNATVAVEGMIDGRIRFSFQEPGERGDILTDRVYRVIKTSNGESPNFYIYFSMIDGRKLRIERNVELSTRDLITLDSSIQ